MNTTDRFRFVKRLSLTTALLALISPAFAASYTFTKIAESSPGGLSIPGGYPALNNDGQVVFDGVVGVGDTRIFLGDGGPLTTIAMTTPSGFTGFTTGGYDAGASGVAAFFAQFSGGTSISRGNGAATTTISSSTTHPHGAYLSVNAAGVVAFTLPDNDGYGIYYGSGGPATPVAFAGTARPHSTLGNPSINASGQVAYQANDPTGGPGFPTERLFVFTPGEGSTEVTNSTSGGFAVPAGLAANAVLSDSGAVAFQAMSGGALPPAGAGFIFVPSVTGVYLAEPNGTPPPAYTVSLITDTTGPYDSFSFNAIDGISINSSDTVAFRATLDSGGGHGIFTGDDPVADKVIKTGDALFGSTVTSVQFGRFALNDSGSVAFFANLQDGRSVIVRADVSQVPVLTKLYLKDDTVPTAPPLAKFKAMGVPAIDPAGHLGFKTALYHDANVNGTNDAMILADKGAVELAIVAREGDEVTGIPGSKLSSFFDPIFNGDGDVIFRAKMKVGQGNVMSSDDEGIFSDDRGAVHLGLREGGDAPGTLGTGGQPLFGSFSSVAALNGGGLVVSKLRKGVGGVDSTNDDVLHGWDDSNSPLPAAFETELLLREGSTFQLALGDSRTVKSFKLLAPLSGVGGQGRSFRFNGRAAALVTFSNSSTAIMDIEFHEAGFILSAVLPSSFSVSGLPGAQLKTIGVPTIDSAGNLAFRTAFVSGPGGVMSADDAAIVKETAPGLLAILAREGQSAPGTGSTFASFGDPVDNDDSGIVFQAKAKQNGVSVTSLTDSGIYVHDGTLVHLVAREGRPLAEYPGGEVIATFKNIVAHEAGVTFVALLRKDVGGVSSVDDMILGYHRAGDFGTVWEGPAILRENQELEVGTGDTRTVKTFKVLTPQSGVKGVGRSFNDGGQVVVYVQFTNGTFGIFRIDP